MARGGGRDEAINNDDDIIIDDIYIPPQIVQGAHTDIDVAGHLGQRRGAEGRALLDNQIAPK